GRLSNQLRRLLHPDDFTANSAVSTQWHQERLIPGLEKTARGWPNMSKRVPATPSDPSPTDEQRGVLDKDLRSPYTERWSFGFQRQLGNRVIIDGSYVGSESHKLTTWDYLNNMQPNGQRLHPGFGTRDIRASEGNSSCHAMQWRVD